MKPEYPAKWNYPPNQAFFTSLEYFFEVCILSSSTGVQERSEETAIMV